MKAAVSLSIDTKQLDQYFSKVSEEMQRDGLGKAVLAGLFQLEAYAKLNVRSTFKQRTGFFAANWETKLDEVSKAGAKGHTSPLAVYARIHELGGVIKATHAEALVFQTDDGEWHRVKSVTMPARPYLRPAADENKDDIFKAVSFVLNQIMIGK